MTEIGKINKLRLVKHLSFGAYLDGGELGEILLPARYVPEQSNVDDLLDVFVYLDSEDRIIATTETPYAMVGDFAFLKVVSNNAVGSFLDWGLPKDLLVPFREQKMKMEEGKSYVVKVYLDKESGRIVASAKIEAFLDNTPPEYEINQLVNLLIYSETDIGFKAIVNGIHTGLLYKNEVFSSVKTGSSIKGYVKKVREDDKIDLYLQKPGYDRVDEVSCQILKYLMEHGGSMPLTDKTSPDEIYHYLGISKKTYKMAIGALYKKGSLYLDDKGVHLVNSEGD